MRRSLVSVGALLLAWGCASPPIAQEPFVRPPGQPTTVVEGTVKSVKGAPLAGLVLLEKGELHGNVWDRGTRVGRDGRFRIEVAEGGQYGLHLYASGYFYRPQAINAETGKSLKLDLVLAPEPTRDRDPVIRSVAFRPEKDGVTIVTVDVSDPDDNLGPQVMAFNAATGRAYAMSPPRRVRDLRANFPQGEYRLRMDTSRLPVDPKDWHFVVADHACWASDIVSFPHAPQPYRVVQQP